MNWSHLVPALAAPIILAAAPPPEPVTIFGMRLGQPLTAPPCLKGSDDQYDLSGVRANCAIDAGEDRKEVYLSPADRERFPFLQDHVVVMESGGKVQTFVVATKGRAAQFQALDMLKAKFGEPTQFLPHVIPAQPPITTFLARWKLQTATVQFIGVDEDDPNLGLIAIQEPQAAQPTQRPDTF